ncbi:hypothetical protein H8959_019429 [Pygathrix nigripes]
MMGLRGCNPIRQRHLYRKGARFLIGRRFTKRPDGTGRGGRGNRALTGRARIGLLPNLGVPGYCLQGCCGAVAGHSPASGLAPARPARLVPGAQKRDEMAKPTRPRPEAQTRRSPRPAPAGSPRSLTLARRLPSPASPRLRQSPRSCLRCRGNPALRPRSRSPRGGASALGAWP